ncbi:hypothetical protein HGRIS_013311 [Hohenbuehelia grisea]|uniref:Uncharacterized protein n=1 Tax=Hohenbuehelia grisea TaxID=104357 RepID=A0ABR3IV59_9AGAR
MSATTASPQSSPLASRLPGSLPAKPRYLWAQATETVPHPTTTAPGAQGSPLDKHARYYRRHREEIKEKARRHWHARGKHLRAARRAQVKQTGSNQDVDSPPPWKSRIRTWYTKACALKKQFGTAAPSRFTAIDSRALQHCEDGEAIQQALEDLQQENSTQELAAQIDDIRRGRSDFLDDFCSWLSSRPEHEY